MRESVLWQYIERTSPPWFKIERFEVLYPVGGSDCFWTDMRTVPAQSGWLELKQCEPDNDELRVGRIPKLKPHQPMFMRRMVERLVPSALLLRVGDDHWMLWQAQPTHEWVRDVRGNGAVEMADWSHTGKLNYEHLVHRLRMMPTPAVVPGT